MVVLKNALVGAGFASLALANPRVTKRGTVPADGTIWTSCVEKGVIALTFDDGPYTYTQHVVDQFTAAGHRVTFFQNGQNYDSIYNYNATLQSMIAGGHQIGSHTWSHADLTTLTADGITTEMTELEAAHLAIIGKIPTYMRPPYLATDALVLSTLQGLGYKIIEVDIDTQDWAEAPIGEIQLSIDWYEGNQTAGGTLSLNHDVYEPTADTFVPAIIAYLATKGLKSVPVGECLGDDAANWYRGGSTVAPPATPSSSGVPVSIPSGNGTIPVISKTPTGPGSPTGAPPKHTGPYKPVLGGDTEPGHGADSGRGALPGHSGSGDYGTPPSANSSKPSYTGSGSGSGSGSSYPAGNTTANPPQPSYYTSSATALTSSAFVLGIAAFALFL